MQNRISPIWVLEKGKIDKGKIGLLVGERGAGKSACLTNIGIERLLDGKEVLHVSLEDLPDRVEEYYEVKIKEVGKKPENIEGKKMIFSYMNQSFNPAKLEEGIRNLIENGYRFDVLLIDGLETKDLEIIKNIKKIASAYGLETWISYPQEIYLSMEKELKDVSDSVLKLYVRDEETYIVLEKAEKGEEGKRLNLDPISFFVKSP